MNLRVLGFDIGIRLITIIFILFIERGPNFVARRRVGAVRVIVDVGSQNQEIKSRLKSRGGEK